VEGRKTLDRLTKLIDDFGRRTAKLQHALEREPEGDAFRHARHFRDVVIPAMESLRETGDELELMMPHETWPLATYREMLFIK
jgi:glutamine synthetase type III